MCGEGACSDQCQNINYVNGNANGDMQGQMITIVSSMWQGLCNGTQSCPIQKLFSEGVQNFMKAGNKFGSPTYSTLFTQSCKLTQIR